jgi:cell division protein FtsL
MLGEGGTLAEAQSRAHALLEQVLRQQASMVAFEKAFLIMGITFTLALPLLLLFRTGRMRSGGQGH